MIEDRTVIDSERAVLVHRSGTPPTYAFPAEDVRDLPTSLEPASLGYVRLPWAAATRWYEEEEQVFGGHPRNPYHRIDCVRACRRLRVEAAGAVLVDTTDVISVYETSRAPQLYTRREQVRMDLLVPSSTVTYCPYKGSALHWNAIVDGTLVRDVAWSYGEPLPESTPIAGMLGFYAERTQMIQDVPAWFAVPPPANPREPEQNHAHG
jgi:uncharacterized protein (DUF427 family)